MKSILLVVLLLGLIVSPALAGNWELELGGSAILGESDSTDVFQGDDVLLRLSAGYGVIPSRVIVGVSVVQPTQDEQIFGIYGKGYASSNTESTFRIFARVGAGGLTTKGESAFGVNAALGAQLNLMDNIKFSGELSNVSDLTEGELTAAQLFNGSVVFAF